MAETHGDTQSCSPITKPEDSQTHLSRHARDARMPYTYGHSATAASPGISCQKSHKPSPATRGAGQALGRGQGGAAHRDPRREQPGLWVGNRLPGGSLTVLGIHSPKLTSAPATPWAPDNASPAPRCPLPTSQRYMPLVPSEGSISLNCSQLAGTCFIPGALSLHLSQPPDLPVGPPSPSAALPTPILTPSPGCTGSPPPAVGCWHRVGGLAPQRRG